MNTMQNFGGPAGRMMRNAQGMGLIRGAMASNYASNPDLAAPAQPVPQPEKPIASPAVRPQTSARGKKKKRIPRYKQQQGFRQTRM